MILSPSVVAQCSQLQDRFKINFIGFSGIGLGVLMATLFFALHPQMSTKWAWLILFSFSALICILLSVLLKSFKSQLTTLTAIPAAEHKVDGIFYCLLIVYSTSAFALRAPIHYFGLTISTHTLHLEPDRDQFQLDFIWSGECFRGICCLLPKHKNWKYQRS